MSNIKTIETITESRSNWTIIEQIEKKTGMTYEEFNKLDIDEQNKMLYGGKLKYDTRVHIDGVPIDDKHIITYHFLHKKSVNFIKKFTEKDKEKQLTRFRKWFFYLYIS